MLIDTHAHLDDEAFETQRAEVIQRALDAGVNMMLAVGTTADSSEVSVGLARQHASVFAAVGIQPNYCAQVREGDWDRVVALAEQPKVVAIGETGLDCYWDHAPLELQQEYFRRHIALSRALNLPFIVHLRESGQQILQVLREECPQGSLSGVMHSFTGDWELAREFLDLGLYISFAGMVTFKKSIQLRDVAARVPADRILIETDSPYLSPHPLRGKHPNEPARVAHIAACLAEVRGVGTDEFGETTSRNAERLFCFRGAEPGTPKA